MTERSFLLPLVPVAKRPQQAAPSNRLLDLLTALAADSRNCLALLSGRSTENLDRWFGSVRGLWLAAEHGAELKSPLADTWEPLRSQVQTDWKSTVMPILEHFVDRTPGSFLEEKKYALVWHYRMAEPEFGEWLANELVSMLEAMLAETELRAFRGEKIVEVKPVWANKGEALERRRRPWREPAFLSPPGVDGPVEDCFDVRQEEAWPGMLASGLTRPVSA